MLKFYIFCPIVVLSFSCFSEILKIDEDLSYRLYIDTLSIKNRDDKVFIISIKDYSDSQYVEGKKFNSIKISFEFDCLLSRHRVIFASLHLENMAKNKPISENKTSSTWLKDMPTSDAGKVSEFACNKVASKQSIMESCLKSAADSNKISPIVLDKYSSLMMVTCGESLSRIVMTFNYSLTMLKAEVKKENVEGFFTVGKNKFCTDASANKLLKYYDIEWKVSDMKGAFIASKIYKKEDCR